MFRFNRPNSTTRGMLFFRLLEQGVAIKPTTYDALVANPKPKRTTPTPPTIRRREPASLAGAALDRPWRGASGEA